MAVNPLAIDIQDISFNYADNGSSFFNGFSLQIKSGDRFGLFGPNGAGKTTLMNLMTGLLPYRHGNVKLFGIEVSEHKRSVNKLFGFVPQDFSLYQELSPIENMEFFGAWYGLTQPKIKQRAAELLEILGLAEVSRKPVHQFSGGMKRRVNLAIGVMHNPALLFLDEPTVGVDVQTRHAIICYLKQINDEGTTLVYTSHQLSEAEDLCNKIAMIDNGRIIAHNDLNTLLAQNGQQGLEGLFLSLTGKDYRD